jgi:hypothetical protein
MEINTTATYAPRSFSAYVNEASAATAIAFCLNWLVEAVPVPHQFKRFQKAIINLIAFIKI